jgi:hypothetical protein
VFAVRCPNPACRKYQLVEAADRGTTVLCLICKMTIDIPSGLPVGTPKPAVPIPAALSLPAAAVPAVPPAPPTDFPWKK